ncbi:hypothetical protein [Vibrio algivorus]|uniref:Porin n=1 Tax=Vibrio algivorus TaxID=1667024 RepID=A0A557P9T9_9VIBR|nr:hypothetical protein [Vibrio algivorus]TVO37424.1 hypothetical protein FOF44_07395 [Vibrio algivorus]GLT13817.1 hypothetical protein GCM10007931_07910 [Vibrio algivorus]
MKSNNQSYRRLLFLCSLLVTGFNVNAEEQETELQDMSDPLAVFTQLGAGVTDKGLNLKVGQTYDTGNASTAGMNIIELKGILGESLGWSGNSGRDDSIDSFRWRNFSVNLENGRAQQLDINYNVEANPLVAEQSADISYSMIQALPEVAGFQFYPLAGIGASVGNNAIDDPEATGSNRVDEGYSLMGTYGLVGMYSKFKVTDKIWLNYNPMWLTTISGSDNYMDNYYGKDQSHLMTHEFAASYQFTPRFNVRYFANWNENTDFIKGDHRIEFNYQI